MRRRELLQVMIGGTAVSVLAACAPLAPTAVTPSAAAGTRVAAVTPGQPAQPRSGGTLRLGQNVEIAAGGAVGASALDGNNISPAPLSAIWLGYDSLVRYDDSFKPQPMLAESWDVATDYKRIK